MSCMFLKGVSNFFLYSYTATAIEKPGKSREALITIREFIRLHEDSFS